ncbi:MAG: TRAP transporter substrate-binding protein [Steroidobacteraceae bacterium]
MKRRRFLRSAAAATAGAALSACARQQTTSTATGAAQTEFRWKMVTTWPPNLPGLGTGASDLAQYIEAASNGRIRIKVYGAGELVPAFEVFDNVANGTAELGHGASYYWKGKAEAATFFSAIPFGFTANEMNAWLLFGGGMELWRELYEPFGVWPLVAGNTGVQSGGWFKREINTPDDLKGLKMRIPGLGGEVLARAGGTPVTLPGTEIFTALQTGAIDAAEWVGPYNDLALGFHKAARYYYQPGWQEPGPALECIVNRKAWDALPADLQKIVELACGSVNTRMLAEYDARSFEALEQMTDVHKVDVREFPAEVLAHLKRITATVLEEKAAADAAFARVYESYRGFADGINKWTRIGLKAYLATRS